MARVRGRVISRRSQARFMEAVHAPASLARLDAHLGEEFALTTERAGAPVRRRAEWLAITPSGYVIDEFTFEELRAPEHEEPPASASPRQRGTMDGDDRTAAFLTTDVWVERDGRLQLATRHVSPLPASEAPARPTTWTTALLAIRGE